MLQINLLPPSERKATLSHVEQFHRTPLMLILFGILVACPLLLLVPLGLRRQQLDRLNTQIQTLTPKKLELDRLRQLTQQLRAQREAFQGLRGGQHGWAKRLNILSDLTPEGVWFTELALDQSRGLVIQGSAIGQGGVEMVNIGKLVQGLKADADFSAAVKDIQIESIKRAQEKEIEIVQFTLTCTLTKAPGS